jgi:hypothetical protein
VYGFLYGNYGDLAKVSRLWFVDFFLKIFKTHRLVCIFLWIFGYFINVSFKVIANLKFYITFYTVLSKKTFESIFAL